MQSKQFKWDSIKNNELIRGRGVSFEEIVQAIENDAPRQIMQNPSREGQFLLAIYLKDYYWAVPFVIENEDIMLLKTAYKTRKLMRLLNEKRPL